MRFPRLRLPSLESPLIRRELVGLLRTRRAFWLLAAATAVAGLFPLLLWPRDAWGLHDNTAAFFAFAAAQLTAALLFIPAFTAGAISGERERGTYDLLYATLLSPVSIVFAKAAASLGYVLLLLLASAPALSVVYLLGGVTLETVLKSQAITFAAVVMSGLVCLHASMRSERTAQAAVRGVVRIFLWNGGLLIVVYMTIWLLVSTGLMSGPSSWFFLGIITLSPYSALAATIFGGGPIPVSIGEGWWFFPAFAGAVSLCHLIGLLRRVRVPELAPSLRRERRLARRAKKPVPARRSILTRSLLRLGDTEAVRLPVFFKELRSEFFGRRAFRAGAFWGTLSLVGLPAILMVTQINGREKYAVALTWIGSCALGLLALLVPATSASAFPRESEQGNLDFLRGTLTSIRDVVLGKFLAGIHAVSGVFLAAAAAIGVLGLLCLVEGPGHARTSRQPAFFLAIILLAATLLVFTALSNLASVAARRTLGGLVIAYGVLVSWLVVLPILLAFGGPFEPIVATNPFAAMQVIASLSVFNEKHLLPAALLIVFELLGTLACRLISANLAESRWARDR